MKLSYGDGVTYELRDSEVIRVRAHLADVIAGPAVAAAAREALAKPLDYPSLASATVPGDSVAIALQYDTPQMVHVVDGTLKALEHAGIEKSSITVLLASEFTGDEELQRSLHDVTGDDVRLAVHDANLDDQLALLGITEAGRTLRLNRILCDADLVIPIGPAAPTGTVTPGMMFPGFSDQATLNRFRGAAAHETVKAQQKLVAEMHECAWMLGVGLELQVVPGPSGNVAAVYCGSLAGLGTVSGSAYSKVWTTSVESRADLVVATIVGNETQQTWQNLSRALIAAGEVLAPGGAIAVCSEISTRPGPSGKRLRDSPDLAETERKLLKDEFPDSLAALQICRSLQRGTVYLKSRLDPELVERLGLAPITSNEEIDRLVYAYHRCIVLEEAQHLMPVLAK